MMLGMMMLGVTCVCSASPPVEQPPVQPTFTRLEEVDKDVCMLLTQHAQWLAVEGATKGPVCHASYGILLGFCHVCT